MMNAHWTAIPVHSDWTGQRATSVDAALLIAGALWIGLDAEPGWPGWFGTAAGLLIIVSAGVGEKG